MSTINDTNTSIVAVLSATSLAYTLHHAYKFDGCRCLIPRKKEWFRSLLTWMLLFCSLGMFIWGAGWAYVKYKLGWTYIPQYGAIPYPTAFYTEEYTRFNTPLTFWVCLSYSLQVSLNAEEGLYWWHLMRAVRLPKSGTKGWFASPFFYAWIVITILTPTAVVCAGWVGYKNMDTQMGRMFVCGGIIEFLVCMAASTVLVKFPQFLRDVKQSGAGPEVRSRLHFYHQANKVRTFFRFIFTSSVLVLGADGLTEKKRINLNHLVSDFLHQLSFGAYFFASIISVMVYLPRNYASQDSSQVLVGNAHPDPDLYAQAKPPGQGRGGQGSLSLLRPPRLGLGGYAFDDTRAEKSVHSQGSHALISLSRDGGQWDADDDLRVALTRGAGTGAGARAVGVEGGMSPLPVITPTAGRKSFGTKRGGLKPGPGDGLVARARSWDDELEDGRRPRTPKGKRLTVLQNWTSPFETQADMDFETCVLYQRTTRQKPNLILVFRPNYVFTFNKKSIATHPVPVPPRIQKQSLTPAQGPTLVLVPRRWLGGSRIVDDRPAHLGWKFYPLFLRSIARRKFPYS
ncbi:hypothetical protein IAT40_004606 [Kwoniella sp. CBS 6097]